VPQNVSKVNLFAICKRVIIRGMEKRTYIKEMVQDLGGPSKLGRQLGVSKSTVAGWSVRGLPAAQAIRIERLTDGDYRLEDLLPELHTS
jgi:DNA-binding transcriptional regulator YdaS (Cro superfamily)